MFSVRETVATNKELARQRAIEQVVLFGKRPTTFIEKKAAAIIGHPLINPILNCKIRNSLDVILEFSNVENNNDNDNGDGGGYGVNGSTNDVTLPNFEDPELKNRIRHHLDTVNVEIGSTLKFIRKLPILSVQPIQPIEYTSVLAIRRDSAVNLADFENILFNGRVKYRYMRGTSFAAYVYQNILYSLNTYNVESLEGLDVWQARYAVFLKRTNLAEYAAMKAFYIDTVYFQGVGYDTSFVPKYDVANLKPQDPIPYSVTDASQIDYYYKVDVKSVLKIPDEKIGIFLTFPFKDGHYIKPNGRIRYLGLNNNKSINNAILKSSRLMIDNICSLNDLEAALDNAARSVKLDDIIYRAVYSKSLKEQAVALLIIRRIVGNYVRVGKYIIHVPNEMTILSWTKISCDRMPIMLPPIYEDRIQTNIYVAMIRDIAQSCYNKMGACILASKYFVPEINLSSVYQMLKNDSEKYVFFTMVMQEYPTPMYLNARNALNPTFGDSHIDLSKYSQRKRQFVNTSINERLNDITEPLVDTPNYECTPYDCMELYEFHNDQLKVLVETGDVGLDTDQLVNFITLSIL
ncbi:ACH96155.1 GrBNV gp76-like protein [Kallithea virus]|uniref:ACH96155.1 GrBNV gp76-like protein n=1 Tax=Kallithea virus TaxID=1654582 RepID=A0A0F7KMV3_9VIRU|nr:ACH96155.1 GrBNV gp76-like protein [Kallithea virus]AKH40349.1 putative gp76-like protein [Kallithea virus]AQN78576.1 ACH96155.1 GrBNV gp76-like protein [Kallithea virus]